MIDAAIRVTVLLAATWLVASLMGRASAATRHLLWTVAVVTALGMPLLSSVTPRWNVLPAGSAYMAAHATNSQRPTSDGDSASMARDRQARQMEAGMSESSPRPAFFFSAVAQRSGAADLAVGLWVSVTLLLLLRVGLGVRAIRRLARYATPADARWRDALESACAALRLGDRIRIRISPDVSMPMTFGRRVPVILLPQAAREWPDDRVRLVLLHELAHIARGDWTTHLMARTLAAVHWFNPLAWIALRRMTAERERACDDRVLALGAVPSDYASHLLDIARAQLPAGLGTAALAMARPSELEGRLLSILRPHGLGQRRSTGWTLATASIVLATAVAAADRVSPMPADTVSRMTEGTGPRSVPAWRGPSRDWISQDTDVAEERRRMAKRQAELQPLASTALDHPDEDAREKATLSLALRSDAGVVDALVGALKDESSQVREKAAIGLALRRDPRVLEALLDAADDPDSQVREKVLIALSLTGDHRAADVLTRSLSDPDGQVREKAASGLTLLSLTSLASRDRSR